MKNVEDDIDSVISNISKVDKIIFGEGETKILFQK